MIMKHSKYVERYQRMQNLICAGNTGNSEEFAAITPATQQQEVIEPENPKQKEFDMRGAY
jgi:hypothetical protein